MAKPTSEEKEEKKISVPIETIEFVYPAPEDEPFSKDAKSLSDIIRNFQVAQGDSITIIDIKYSFNIISRMKMNPIDPSDIKAMDIPVSSALVMFKEN